MWLEMLVFRVVLLVKWFNYVNAGRTSEMRVTWEGHLGGMIFDSRLPCTLGRAMSQILVEFCEIQAIRVTY